MELNQIYNMDCIEGMKNIEENTIDLILTDPPYNYEFLNHNWNHDEVDRRIERVQNSKTLVKNIPYGSGLSGGVRNKKRYEKNYNNIVEYGEWCKSRGKECFRSLKPGGFILIFNSSRTIAHVQVAMESVGFYARDILVWRRHSGIPKGVNFEKKMQDLGDNNYEIWKGWHSCLRQEREGIVVLQKPLIDNYHTTVQQYGIGLFKAENGIGGFKGNIFENYKRDKKDEFNSHCTIKPLKLIEDLIEMCVPIKKERIVLDPFIGSGTTAVACINTNRNYIGFELDKQYYEIATQRIKNHLKN